MILFTIMFDKKKRTINYAKAYGIISAMTGRKSWYRVKSLINDQEN